MHVLAGPYPLVVVRQRSATSPHPYAPGQVETKQSMNKGHNN